MSDGITEARLSLVAGPLAPGRTYEGLSSEIETIVRPSPATESGELSIESGATQDHFRAGRLGPNAGMNLNVGQEPTEPDVDVTVERPRQVGLSLRTGAGNDTLDLTGGRR